MRTRRSRQASRSSDTDRLPGASRATICLYTSALLLCWLDSVSLPSNSSSEREHRYTDYTEHRVGAVLLALLRASIDHERNSQHIPGEQQEAPARAGAMRGQRTHQLHWTESTTTDKPPPHPRWLSC